MNILIFGGTTEGRILAEELCGRGHRVAVSCATEVGIEELRSIPCARLCGRLNAEQMAGLVPAYDLVIDATHPYSVEVTANIRSACEGAGVALRRVLRAPGENPDCVQVRSCEEAAEFLQGTDGNILLTTGSKELAQFSILPSERIYARVLPTHFGLDACEKIGLPHRNILALQGPFSKELNEAMLRQYRIRWLVTRNSGAAGGFTEKISAAEAAGVQVILIELPESTGSTVEEMLKEAGSCV